MRIAHVAFLACVAACTPAMPGRSLEYPAPRIREEQLLTVAGRRETWRLEWRGEPRPYCPAADGFGSQTCPCYGFAYGEAGDLWLARIRDGKEIDRLDLSPFFRNGQNAIVPRWPPKKGDLDDSDREDFVQRVARRPAVRVMHFADYDHDGAASEFYLQTDAVACGWTFGVVIGVSAKDPRLHAFGAASSPDRPLYLRDFQWEALRRASTEPVRVRGWTCGDHGSDTQAEVLMEWSAAGIEGTQSEYTCPPPGQPRRLLGRKPLSAVDED